MALDRNSLEQKAENTPAEASTGKRAAIELRTAQLQMSFGIVLTLSLAAERLP